MRYRNFDLTVIEALVVALSLTALYAIAARPALPLFFILAHLLGAAGRDDQDAA